MHVYSLKIYLFSTFPDGYSFGSGSDDSTVRVFDVRFCGQVVNHNST